MKLTANKTYAATVRLSALESIATNKMVAQKFTDMGFSNVQVTGGGKERSATGTWAGPDMDVEIPAQLTNIKDYLEAWNRQLMKVVPKTQQANV